MALTNGNVTAEIRHRKKLTENIIAQRVQDFAKTHTPIYISFPFLSIKSMN